MALSSYKELIVWQKAMVLVESVYTLTKSFPREEIYSLSTQLRRAAISVPANIAEGQGRKSTKEFLRHLSIAYGSLMETETQILLAERLGYGAPQSYSLLLEQLHEVGRLINGLTKSLTDKLNANQT